MLECGRTFLYELLDVGGEGAEERDGMDVVLDEALDPTSVLCLFELPRERRLLLVIDRTPSRSATLPKRADPGWQDCPARAEGSGCRLTACVEPRPGGRRPSAAAHCRLVGAEHVDLFSRPSGSPGLSNTRAPPSSSPFLSPSSCSLVRRGLAMIVLPQPVAPQQQPVNFQPSRSGAAQQLVFSPPDDNARRSGGPTKVGTAGAYASAMERRSNDPSDDLFGPDDPSFDAQLATIELPTAGPSRTNSSNTWRNKRRRVSNVGPVGPSDLVEDQGDDSSDEDGEVVDERYNEGEEYEAVGFGDFGRYMRNKRKKLHVQEAALREKDTQKRPQVFKGLTIHASLISPPTPCPGSDDDQTGQWSHRRPARKAQEAHRPLRRDLHGLP